MIKWAPPGLVCFKCGGPNPDKGEICGSCDEPAGSPKEGLLPLDQQIERKIILEAVHYEAQK